MHITIKDGRVKVTNQGDTEVTIKLDQDGSISIETVDTVKVETDQPITISADSLKGIFAQNLVATKDAGVVDPLKISTLDVAKTVKFAPTGKSAQRPETDLDTPAVVQKEVVSLPFLPIPESIDERRTLDSVPKQVDIEGSDANFSQQLTQDVKSFRAIEDIVEALIVSTDQMGRRPPFKDLPRQESKPLVGDMHIALNELRKEVERLTGLHINRIDNEQDYSALVRIIQERGLNISVDDALIREFVNQTPIFSQLDVEVEGKLANPEHPIARGFWSNEALEAEGKFIPPFKGMGPIVREADTKRIIDAYKAKQVLGAANAISS